MIPLSEKLVISAAIILVGSALCTIGRSRFQWLRDPKYWRWGAQDPIRIALFNDDGDIRRFTIVVCYTLLLALLWFVD